MSNNTDNLHIGQICYIIDGYMLCNFVVRYGKKIESKLGKMMKFKVNTKGRSDNPLSEFLNAIEPNPPKTKIIPDCN